ncbi:hypothetical protein DERP_010141 [Dermatophagoides pteronyssinus]|uniref:Uncharacterized protein n=1 Tax=Dermatophagoides pteronyssinus TaxID=6956 RepID=A0ABQ8JFL5_DERPT|nr:hypothetical protein DERP_010141 [Dermatophagoides pteronyssinus]
MQNFADDSFECSLSLSRDERFCFCCPIENDTNNLPCSFVCITFECLRPLPTTLSSLTPSSFIFLTPSPSTIESSENDTTDIGGGGNKSSSNKSRLIRKQTYTKKQI